MFDAPQKKPTPAALSTNGPSNLTTPPVALRPQSPGARGQVGIDRFQDLVDRGITIDPGTVEWTNMDAVRLWVQSLTSSKAPEDLLTMFKRQWVIGYRRVILDAAREFKVPFDVVAAIAYNEVGGDPPVADQAAYLVRSAGLLGGRPERTSFGDLSMQLRTAEEVLGFKVPTEGALRARVASLLDNKRGMIYLAAARVRQLILQDFGNRPQLSREQKIIVITRYARGSGLPLARIKTDLYYGKKGMEAYEKFLAPFMTLED